MPWLSTWRGPGVDDRADQDRHADRVDAPPGSPALVSASTNGSTAVEFSGQTTKSGCGTRPAATSRGEVDRRVDVVLGDLAVVEEDVVAVAGHVALDRGDGDVRPSGLGPYGASAGASGQRQRRRPARRPPPAGPARAPAPAEASRRAEQREQEADAGRRRRTAARRRTGVSTAAKASRPHGIPLNGQALRTTSIATHAAATHSGQSRRRPSDGRDRAQERRRRAPRARTARARRRCRPRASRRCGRSRSRPRRRARAPGPAGRAGRGCVSTKPATANGISEGDRDRLEGQGQRRRPRRGRGPSGAARGQRYRVAGLQSAGEGPQTLRSNPRPTGCRGRAVV